MTDKQRIHNLENAVRLAILHLENPPGLYFSQRNKGVVLNWLAGVLAGVERIEDRDVARRLPVGKGGQGHE